MKKSDLKTGMWIVCKNGKRGMILLGTKDGDIISGDTNWCSLDNYNDNLEPKTCSHFGYNIVKVLQPNANMYYYNIDQDVNDNVIWDREKCITVKATIDMDSIKEIENVLNELQNKLENMQIIIK